MSQFKLPDVGEGLNEAEILTWHVTEGDQVKVNDVLVDIETAKSIVELPSPFEGTVTKVLVAEGTTVRVGTPIIDIGPEATSVESEPERQAVLVGYGPRTGTPRRRRKKAAEAPVAAGDGADPSLRVLAKPPVRKLAKDLGIDLHDVARRGEIVTRTMLEGFIANRHAAESEHQETERAHGEERLPVKGVRKTMAEAMVSSAFTAPHASVWLTCDVSATVELIARLRKDRAFADRKVSPTLMVAKVVCLVLARHRVLNSHWDEDAREIVLHRSVNLGIAVATDRGLLVPNIPGAESLTLPELALALDELTETARTGRTRPAQMRGGTFTITNVGMFGVDGGTPILNPGESGILAVGAIQRRPWVIGDQIVPRWVTTLALSFDHRNVDGAEGAHFLADVADVLADPARALAF